MNSRPMNSAAESDGDPSHRSVLAPPEQAELPRLTPLQFLVIRLLLDGRKTGRGLRRQLGSWGAEMSKAAFSQLMRRLEFAGLVRNDSVTEDSPGPPKRHCVYQARVQGLKRWRAARDFYARLTEPPGAEEHLFDEAIQRRQDRYFEKELLRATMACARAQGLLPPDEDAIAPP